MEKEIVKLTKDIEHVKDTTEKIERGVDALIAKAEENHVDIVDLRGRVRELEHKYNDLKSLVWKIFIGVSGATGATFAGVKFL